MTTTIRRAAVALVVGTLTATAACTTTQPAELPAPAPPITAPDPASQAADAALAAYNAFWAVSLNARAAPNARDWTSELATVASGDALESVTADIDNYAGVPAHFEGTVGRAPTVQNATPDRVEITDCLDMTAYLLRGDENGELLSDTANQVPRFLFTAEVLPDSSGRWLVDEIDAKLSQPC
jgi:hypothetical protein